MPMATLDRQGDIPTLWGIRDVARRLGVDKQTITRMVKRGHFPKPLKLSPTVHRWNPTTVEAHLSALENPVAATEGKPEAGDND